MELRINGEKYILEPDNDINAVMLFGSWARGENDLYSDMDILIVTESETYEKYEMLSAEGKVDEDWLTIYSKKTLLKMKKYSSLFLWHLKKEGITLYKKNEFLNILLERLPAYTKTWEDLEQYQCICNDINDIIQKESDTYVYEMALLAAVIRNTCIAYCYLHGEMIFGRTEPVKRLLERKPLFSIESYQKLYRYRSEFRLTMQFEKKIDISDVEVWLERANGLLKYVRNEYGKSRISAIHRGN